MSANRFVLKHREIEIDYTIGANPGFTALTYKDGDVVKCCQPMEVTTEETALGCLVSVSLQATPPEPGAGSESFGFFLPDLDVKMEQSEKFVTVGVYRTSGAPVPERPAPVMRCIELHGTAQCVVVPLLEATTA
jgi:hypothetical protein